MIKKNSTIYFDHNFQTCCVFPQSSRRYQVLAGCCTNIKTTLNCSLCCLLDAVYESSLSLSLSLCKITLAHTPQTVCLRVPLLPIPSWYLLQRESSEISSPMASPDAIWILPHSPTAPGRAPRSSSPMSPSSTFWTCQSAPAFLSLPQSDRGCSHVIPAFIENCHSAHQWKYSSFQMTDFRHTHICTL